MADYLGVISRSEVVNSKTFMAYAHQRIGVPPLQQQNVSHFNKRLKEFFASYPNANYQTLTKIVDYILARGLRPTSMLVVLSYYRKAWAAGYLPECDPQVYHDPELEKKLYAALDLEEHPRWIERLKHALWFYSDIQRGEVYESWKQDRLAAGMKVA